VIGEASGKVENREEWRAGSAKLPNVGSRPSTEQRYRLGFLNYDKTDLST
jgi:hypothetical protein